MITKIKLAVCLVILLIVISGCTSSKIVLKKYEEKKAPFKQEEGNYTLNLYHIKYPETMQEKEEFFKKLEIFLNKVFIQEKQYSILVSKEYIADYERLQKDGLLEEEKIFVKIASSLNSTEKKKLEELLDIEVKRHEGTIQKYLNLQIAYLKMILDEEDFDSEKVYTELYKENIINKIKKKRKNIIMINDKINIDYVVEIKDPYRKEDKGIAKATEYYYNKEIEYGKLPIFDESIKTYKQPILLRGLKKHEISVLLDKEENLNNNCIILENNAYTGYRYQNSSYYFFVGGNEKIYEFEKYKIDIRVKEEEIENLLKFDEEYILTDFTGGK